MQSVQLLGFVPWNTPSGVLSCIPLGALTACPHYTQLTISGSAPVDSFYFVIICFGFMSQTKAATCQ